MPKLILTVLLSIFTIIAFARKKELTPEQKKALSEIEYTVEVNQVENLLRKFIHHIKNGKPGDKPLKPMEYDIVGRRLESWIKYRWFIADTRLSRKWLDKVHKLIVYMAKTKRFINASEFSGNTGSAKYAQAVKYYDVAYKRLVKLLKKPVKVSEKVHRQHQVEKIDWQRAMRKKYKLDK